MPGELVQHGEEEAATDLRLKVWGENACRLAHQNPPLRELNTSRSHLSPVIKHTVHIQLYIQYTLPLKGQLHGIF
jgi:hypothetical protein